MYKVLQALFSASMLDMVIGRIVPAFLPVSAVPILCGPFSFVDWLVPGRPLDPCSIPRPSGLILSICRQQNRLPVLSDVTCNLEKQDHRYVLVLLDRSSTQSTQALLE